MNITKKLCLHLTSKETNIDAVLKRFKRQARHEKWSKEEIDFVLAEAKSGDYDHACKAVLQYSVNNEDEEVFCTSCGDFLESDDDCICKSCAYDNY